MESRLKTAQLRVANRYLIRLASQKAATPQGPTAEELELLAWAFLPQEGKVAFTGLVKKLQQLSKALQKAPGLWERLKKNLGVQSITDLGITLKKLADSGYKALRGLLKKLFDTWPLKLYTLEKSKLLSFNTLLEKVLGKFPRLEAAVKAGARKIGDFGEMLRKRAPVLTGIVMAGIYIWIWMNVVEFEWDLESLVNAFTGHLTFHDLLASLPASIFGFLLNYFGFGTFTLLPYTIAARLLWLLGHRYLTWTGRGLQFEWELLKRDFGVEPESLARAQLS